MEILSGLLLLFGGIVMAYHRRIRHELGWGINPIMQNEIIATMAAIIGFITGFYSIYYWIHHFGWIIGLISFVIVGIVSALICNFLSGIFPLILGLGFLALIAGYFIALFAL
jgi:hypothetical protein